MDPSWDTKISVFSSRRPGQEEGQPHTGHRRRAWLMHVRALETIGQAQKLLGI